MGLIDRLTRASGMNQSDIVRIIHTAPKRYKVYTIPKKNGGQREIAQPARELKLLQRLFVEAYLSTLPIHDAATAYRPTKGLLENISPHLGETPILKMDFADFFPSIHGADWARYCERRNFLSVEDRELSSRLLFRQAKGEKTLKLSIGAPSSPMLCNVLMFDFDSLVTTEAKRRGVNYTRYADDLTFSGQRIGMLRDMIFVVEDSRRKSGILNLRVNKGKTKFVTTKFRRTVTGLNIANDGTVSIGRDKKRLVRSKVHHAITGRPMNFQVIQLVGELAFIHSVEPEFVRRLNEVYGCEVMTILKTMISTS